MDSPPKSQANQPPPPGAGAAQAKPTRLSPQARRWLERLQVEAAAVVIFVAAWLVAWPLVKPADPHAALTFLPTGDWTGLIVFAVAVWALSAVAAALTPTARPEGALLAALVAAAALGLHSGSVVTLLQQSEGHLRKTFAALAGETAVMAAVLVGALLVTTVVRMAASRLMPRWAWPGELAPPAREAGSKPGWPAAGRLAGCLVVELAVALVLLVLTFRSREMGQIAFALAASFFVAALVAHQSFPVRSSVPLWLAPLLIGVAILALGGHVAEGQGPPWYQAIMVSQSQKLPLRAALPVHWLGLGCGGAVAGAWLSRRMRDANRGKETERAD